MSRSVSPLGTPRTSEDVAAKQPAVSEHLLEPASTKAGGQPNLTFDVQDPNYLSQHESTSDLLKLPRAKSRRRCPSPDVWWTLELLSEAVALAGLMTIIVLLLHYRGQPLSAWHSSRFTLNGVIALIATITKAALMLPVSSAIGQRKWLWFLPRERLNAQQGNPRSLGSFEAFDEASRGTIGGTKLLWRLRGWDVVYIGVAITFLSILFSTVTQNVVTTDVHYLPSDNPDQRAGHVLRKDFYYDGTADFPKNMNETIWMAALHNGVYGINITQLPVLCSTGNCSWPIVPTLGVCGACKDMKDEFLQSKSCNSTTCEYRVPGGTKFWTAINASAYDEYGFPVFRVGRGRGAVFQDPDLVKGGPVPPGIQFVNFDFVGQPAASYYEGLDHMPSVNDAILVKDREMIAMECGLWVCVQALSTNVSSGILQQSVSEHWHEAHGDSTAGNAGNIYNISNIPSSFNCEPDTVYGVGITGCGASPESCGSIGNLTAITLETLLMNDIWSDGGTRNSGDSYVASIDALPDLGLVSSTVWNAADNMDAWISTLALSLSNAMRQTGELLDAESESRYDGTAMLAQVYIKVRWVWLTFPVALVLLSMLFLMFTIIESSVMHKMLWKNSALATLYTRLDDELQSEVTEGLMSDHQWSGHIDHRRVQLNAEDGAPVLRSAG